MAEFPALPLWTDAYLADTTHLTREEHGVYLLLMMAAWRSPGCRLPDDDDFLARVSRCGPQPWRRLRQVIAPFWTIEGGFWTQKRLSKERAHVAKVSEVRRAARASRGNGESEELTSERVQVLVPGASANPLQNNDTVPAIVPTIVPLPTPTPILKDKNRRIAPDEFDAFWAAYPRRTGKGAARRAWATATGKATTSEIMDGLNRATVAWRRAHTEVQFIPHPATWLNGERWADELLPLNAHVAAVASTAPRPAPDRTADAIPRDKLGYPVAPGLRQ